MEPGAFGGDEMAGNDKDEPGRFVPSAVPSGKDTSSGEVGGEPSPAAVAEWSLTGDSDVPDQEPAQPEKRQSKRQIGDTRGLTHGIIYTTSDSITALEDWLNDNCLGKWSMELIAMDDDLLRKRVKIMFELDSDKQSFRELATSDGERP